MNIVCCPLADPTWPNVPAPRQPIPAHVSALELHLHSEMTSCDAGDRFGVLAQTAAACPCGWPKALHHQLDRITGKPASNQQIPTEMVNLMSFCPEWDRTRLNLDMSGGFYKLQLLNASHSDVLSQDQCRGIVLSPWIRRWSLLQEECKRHSDGCLLQDLCTIVLCIYHYSDGTPTPKLRFALKSTMKWIGLQQEWLRHAQTR